MEPNVNSYIIITGGPGSGKTTLIEALRSYGYYCIDEVGRALIKKEVEKDGDALPWKNSKKFRNLMFAESIVAYNSALAHAGPIFFDRGIIDSIAYSQLINEPIPKEMDETSRAYQYNTHVFVAPPWEEIYENDQERKQSFEEAIQTYVIMVKTYEKYGYRPITLPKCHVDARVKFISSALDIHLIKTEAS